MHSIQWDKLICHAAPDYIKLMLPSQVQEPTMSGTACWTREPNRDYYNLTIQNPVFNDIRLLRDGLLNPALASFELRVDLKPKVGVPELEVEALMIHTFNAIARGFRPEDAAFSQYGYRGGVEKKDDPLLPFHRRTPRYTEELIYGWRGDFLQSKMYYKRIDEGRVLSLRDQSVRMELTMRSQGLREFGIARVGDLIKYPYRLALTKHFRVISGVRVRAARGRSELDRVRLDKKIQHRFAKHGVGGFAVNPERRPWTSERAFKMIRARSAQQIPFDAFVLTRDQNFNDKVGSALKQLERRMNP